MLLTLLEERFHLKYHRETKEGPVYLLTKSGKPLMAGESACLTFIAAC